MCFHKHFAINWILYYQFIYFTKGSYDLMQLAHQYLHMILIQDIFPVSVKYFVLRISIIV